MSHPEGPRVPRSGPAVPHDPAMRAADRDREAVAARIQEAAAEGRLGLDELDERLGRAFAAKTFGELAALTADLPPSGPAPRHAPPGGERPLVLRTGGASLVKAGYWQVPSRIVVSSGMGGVRLDFTAADCVHAEVLVDLSVGMGGVTAIVPRGWGVDVSEVGSGLGKAGNRALDQPDPRLPLLRFTGLVRMGSLKVRHPSRGEEIRARRLRRNGP